jgi:SAM-dependent methyltransferase
MDNKINCEIERIKDIYLDRDKKNPYIDWTKNNYHPRHPMGRLFQEHNQNALVRALNQLNISLEEAKILDIGCGFGNWLRYLVELGANPRKLTGIDLSTHRIRFACCANPAINWINNNGFPLPFPQSTFDIVLQFVVFSSVIDKSLRANIQAEISRTTKPGGYILWIDLKKSPRSSLVGFSKSQVINAFPDFSLEYAKSIQPYYYRYLYSKFTWFAKLIWLLTGLGGESWFFILKKMVL